MLKRVCCLICLVLVMIGCTRETPALPLPTNTTIPLPGESSPTIEIPSGDFASRWLLTSDPLVIDASGHPVIVHGLYLGPETILVYSETDPKRGQDISLDMVDNKGRKLPVLSSVHLEPIGSVHFSVVKYAHREPGANSLFIETGPNKVEIARHTDPSESENANHREYGLYTTSVQKLDSYSISVVNWLYTPVTPPPSPTSLPPGVQDENRFTLQVEDLANRDHFYYLIQFLSNGEIIGSVSR